MNTTICLRFAVCTVLALVGSTLPAPAQGTPAPGTPAPLVRDLRDTPLQQPGAGVRQAPVPWGYVDLSPRLAHRPSVWRDLFADTWGDARRFPSKETLGWLAIGTAATLSTRPADSHVGRSLSTSSQLGEQLEAGALIGSTPLQLGMSAATYALGRASHSPRMAAVGADLFRAELLAQGLTIGLKESVRRRRPEGSGFAFPSGHTTVSFASATVLQQHFGWRVGAPVYAVASYVALSRVQMKRHYLSDVAFGAALGIAAGRTITIGRERRMQLAPMAADGGAGVQFVWTGRQ